MDHEIDIDTEMKRFNCHFNWKLEENSDFDGRKVDAKRLEEKLLADIVHNPPVAHNVYLLLAFSFALGDRNNVDFERSLMYTNKASNLSNSPAQEYLVLANRFCIMRIMDNEEANLEMLETVKQNNDELSEEDKANILISEAYSLSNFTIQSYEKALDRYEKAAGISPGNAEAHFGIGKMLGRLRRSTYGPICEPSEKELTSLKQAMYLLPSNPVYRVFYAEALTTQVMKNGVLDMNMVNQVVNLVNSTLDKLKDNEQFITSRKVYGWCARAYKNICKSARLPKKLYGYLINMQRQCIEKALHLAPNNSKIQHQAGMFYWKVLFDKDFEMAEKCLQQATVVHVYQCNFWADIDLIKFYKETKPEYDPLIKFFELKVKYKETPAYLGFLYEQIGMQYEIKGQYDKAMREYHKALKSSADSSHIQKAPRKLEPLLQKFVSASTEQLNNNPGYKSKYIANLFEAAKIYESFSPPKLAEAKKLYITLLDMKDEKLDEARKGFAVVLLKLGLYDECIEEAEKIDFRKVLADAFFYKAENESDCFDVCAVQANISANCGSLKPSQCKTNKLPKQMLFFYRSAQYGSLAGAQRFVELLAYKLIPQHLHFQTTTEVYEKLAFLENMFNQPFVESALNLDVNSPLDLIRRARYKMTLSEVSRKSDTLALAKDTIMECRSTLDRTVRALWKHHFPNNRNKVNCYFPYYHPNNRNVQGGKTKRDLKIAMNRIDKNMTKSLGIVCFKKDYPQLCKFLAYRTPLYDIKYDFVHEFFILANIHKHQEDITKRGFTNLSLYDLAHKAAEFSEEVVKEFYDQMK